MRVTGIKKIIWLTGLPCSGKTTIARALARHINAEILDGDDIRRISSNTDFSPKGRKMHMLSVAEMAYKSSKYAHVIVALVSPIRAVRDEIKEKYPNMSEVFVKCPIETCIKRDVKGMYKKAMSGEVKQFTGISAPYEEPDSGTLALDTSNSTVEESVSAIVERHFPKQKECRLRHQ